MALSVITFLFFIWGFITCLNDLLIPNFKAMFELSYAQAMLVQFCFFAAYFLVSFPAGKIISRIGYKSGIVLGLAGSACGCLLFFPAAGFHSYPVFLFALFVLASGITVLQVAANPYVSKLGPPNTASRRLTLTQAFNSLGTTIAPLVGATLIFQSAGTSFSHSYVWLAASLCAAAALIWFYPLPKIHEEHGALEKTGFDSAWDSKCLRLGTLGIFTYVGAEVAIGSFLVSFITRPEIAGLSIREASHYVAYYWGGAMIGRFLGGSLMSFVKGSRLLMIHALMIVLLIACAMFFSGKIAMISLLSIGLFNSIMFPTIFSLGIEGLGDKTSDGSGILCMAIVGGALIPLLQGVAADSLGLKVSFALPLLCYLYIAYFAFNRGKRA